MLTTLQVFRVFPPVFLESADLVEGGGGGYGGEGAGQARLPAVHVAQHAHVEVQDPTQLFTTHFS